jgi:hypothetical protein
MEILENREIAISICEYFVKFFAVFEIHFRAIFGTRYTISFTSILLKLHIVNSIQKVVRHIFDVNPLQSELLIKFVRLPPEREFLILKTRSHFGYSYKLSTFHYAINIIIFL